MKHLLTYVVCLLALTGCQHHPSQPALMQTASQSTSFKVQYGGALDDFRSVVDFDGDDLEGFYLRARDAYERGKTKADLAAFMIERIDESAQNVLSEWESDLQSYTDPTRRENSRLQLEAARERHAATMAEMRKTQQAMQPVLSQMNDLMLYLRHQLNAIALGAVPASQDELEQQTGQQLIAIERAIDKAGGFVDGLDP